MGETDITPDQVVVVKFYPFTCISNSRLAVVFTLTTNVVRSCFDRRLVFTTKF